MSAIKLINSSPSADTAEFRVYQNDQQVARIGVHQGGQASVPTQMEYTVQATTQMGEFALMSNPVSFQESSINVLARVLSEQGYHDFQLVTSPGTQSSAIVLENTWEKPVQFNLSRPNSPVQIVTVVDEHNHGSISTAQQWTIYAIVNGITTENVETVDPNATITLLSDNNREGFSLKVS